MTSFNRPRRPAVLQAAAVAITSDFRCTLSNWSMAGARSTPADRRAARPATHPCIEAAVGFGMDVPEARVELLERLSMCRTELHNSGHILEAGRSHRTRKGGRGKPMLRHVERDRLIAMAFIERAQTSG